MSITKAKAVVFNELGNSDKLKVEMLPVPEPKRGEVRVKMMAVGLNRAEVVFIEGLFTDKPKQFPSSMGYEGAGIIDKIGEGVKQFKVGDRVAVLCNVLMSEYPTNKEECIFPEHALVKILDGQSYADAAATWLAYLTAYFALVEVVHIKKDDWVVVTCASSSAGLAAIQLAKALGAKVIGTSRTTKKKAHLMEFGLDGFVATDQEDIESKIMGYTNGKGARIIYDSIGNPILEKLANATATGGIIIEYGKPRPNGTMEIPYLQMFAKYIKFKVYFMEEFTTQPAELKKAVEFLNKYLLSFKSIVGKVYKGIDSVPEAHKFLEKSDMFGKTIVEFENIKTTLPSQ